MLFFALLGITFAIAVVVVIRELRDRFGEPLWVGFITLIVGAGISALLMGLLSTVLPDTGVERTEYNLKALGNNNSVEGHFFLGSGVVDEEQHFSFIKEQADGGFKMDSVEVDRATLYEDNSATPQLVVVRGVQDYPLLFPWPAVGRKSYEFHIPEDSIVETYKIDVSK